MPKNFFKIPIIKNCNTDEAYKIANSHGSKITLKLFKKLIR